MASCIKTDFVPFKEGNKVWLEATNLDLGHNRKLASRREGPFQITEVLGPLTYRLELPSRWRIHDVFHAALLSPFTETEEHGPAFTRPPPELVNEEEEYKVEEIISHKKSRNRWLFLVKWRGYPLSEASWEPAANLQNAQQLLLPYRLAHHL